MPFKRDALTYHAGNSKAFLAIALGIRSRFHCAVPNAIVCAAHRFAGRPQATLSSIAVKQLLQNISTEEGDLEAQDRWRQIIDVYFLNPLLACFQP